jgi:ribosome-associated toxin RatA of RatAB toxin-antitoxin module
VYTIVAIVDLYEDFVPWSQSSHILWRKHDDNDQGLLDVEIEVGFKFFMEKYILHVQLVEATQLDQISIHPISYPRKKRPASSFFLCDLLLLPRIII